MIVDPAAGVWRAGPRGAPRVLVLHDAGGEVRGLPVWRGLASDHEVVELDLPGYGGVPLPPAGVDLAWVVAWLEGQLDRLGWGQAVVVGSSLGGWFALELAAAAPARVSGLVLCAPAGLQVPRDYLLALFGLGTAVVERAPAHLIAAAAACSFDPCLADPRTLAVAGRVRCPVRLVWGSDDPMIPTAHGHALVARLRDPQLDELPGVGHLVACESPAAVAAAVRALTGATPSA